MMPDEKASPPINASHDFQLGVLFARADASDIRMDAMDARIAGLTNDIHRVKDDVVREVKDALDAQTRELKPVITEKMVRDANAAAAKLRSDEKTNFAVRTGAIIGICSAIASGILYVDKTYWQPDHPSHVITVPPSVTATKP
jgi:hypothetical protein